MTLITGIFAIAVAIVAWKIVELARLHKPLSIFLTFRPWLIAASLSLAVASIMSFLYRKQHAIAIPVIALCSLLAFKMGSWGYQSHSSIRSAKKMADAIRSYTGQDTVQTYSIDPFEYFLPYYLQRNITVVKFKGNMEFGISREPRDWVASENEFMPVWAEPFQALAVLSLQKYEKWLSQKIPMKIVYQDPRRIVVANY